MPSPSRITPCIWFDDQVEHAAALYARTFPAGRVTSTSRYPESTDNRPGVRAAACCWPRWSSPGSASRC